MKYPKQLDADSIENWEPSRLFLYTLLGAGYLVVTLNNLLGAISRPLWRKLLNIMIGRAEKKDASSKDFQAACDIRIVLLFESRSSWTMVVPWLNRLHNLHERIRLARGFALLYLHNKRSREAIEAAEYCVSLSSVWLQEHPEEAKKALRLHRKFYHWYLRPEQNKDGWWLTDEKAIIAAMKKLFVLSRGLVKDFRDAQVALSMLRWWQNHQANSESLVDLKSTRKEINPLYPFLCNFDWALASRMGIAESEFDEICQQAEKIDFRSRGC